MPAIQADHRNQAICWASQRVDALLGSSWTWDEDDDHDAGAGPTGLLEHERDPGPGAR